MSSKTKNIDVSDEKSLQNVLFILNNHLILIVSYLIIFYNI